MSLYFEKRKVNENHYNITGYESENPYYGERVRGRLTRMPGSPTIWVSHGLYVPPIYRKKGFSTQYNSVLLALAFQELNASAVIASVRHQNGPQQWRLQKLGWRQMSNAMWIITPGEEGDDDSYSSLCDFYPPLSNGWQRTVTWSKDPGAY